MKRQVEGDKAFITYVDSLLCDIKNELANYKGKKVYLFGAGKVGRILLEKLTSGEQIIPISGFAVSSMRRGIPSFYMGYPVMQFDCIEDRKESVFILATTNPNFEYEMLELLKDDGDELYILINKGKKCVSS